MGAFVVNFHVRTSDPNVVDATLAALGTMSRRSEPTNGWIAVYEQLASMQDPDRIVHVACRLSLDTSAPTVAFLVHDSDVAQVWLAEDGAVTSHLDSWPGWPESRPVPAMQTPDALVDLCTDVDLAWLEASFTRDVVFAEDHITAIARALDIDAGLALVDFGDDEADGPGSDAVDLDQIRALIDQQIPPGAEHASDAEVALVEAAHAGDVDSIHRLLGAGTHPDAEASWTPSMARSGPAAGLIPKMVATPLYAASAENQSEAIEVLLAAGADPNGRIRQGSTPLAAAACAGHVNAVRSLLAGGASPSAIADGDMTVIDAVATARTQFDAMRPLLSSMPDLADGAIVIPDAAALDECERLLQGGT